MRFFAIVLSYASWAVARNLNAIHQWKYVDYVWDSSEEKQAAIDKGDNVHENVISYDVDTFNGKVFMTTPKLKEGVPASLSVISNEAGPGGPLLKPYPDWSWHTPIGRAAKCNGITSAWSIVIDECNRLWVLDSGIVAGEIVCPASLILFDAKTDKLLNRFDIPNKVLHSSTTNGMLVTLAVETHGLKCRDAWAYMGDSRGRALLVWHNKVVWRLSSDVYAPSPDATNFTIANESFEFNEGVVSLALSPASDGYLRRKLFFTSMSSFDEFSVPVIQLHKSRTRAVSYEKYGYKLPSQSTAQAFSRRGVLFFGLTSEMSLGCWNMKTPFDADNTVTVAQDNEYLQFVSSIKVKQLPHSKYREEELWVTTNRLQKNMAGTRNWNETNFRILKGSVGELVAGTKCDQ